MTIKSYVYALETLRGVLKFLDYQLGSIDRDIRATSIDDDDKLHRLFMQCLDIEMEISHLYCMIEVIESEYFVEEGEVYAIA